MEWVDGWTVARLLVERGGRCSVPETAVIGYHVLGGLEAAHHLGIVHRDVKPANLMVTHQGQVRLMDLGIAKETDPDMPVSSSTSLGTWIYSSPEQIIGENPLDGRTDLYALGATLYHVITGSPPFSGPSRERAPVEIGHLRPDVPTDLCRALHKALAHSRDDRFQTAAEMRDALARFVPADGRFPGPPADASTTVASGAGRGLLTSTEVVRLDPNEPEPQAKTIEDSFDPLKTTVVVRMDEPPTKFAPVTGPPDQLPQAPLVEQSPAATSVAGDVAETVVVDRLLTVPLSDAALRGLLDQAATHKDVSDPAGPQLVQPRSSDPAGQSPTRSRSPGSWMGRWQGMLCFGASLLVIWMALSTSTSLAGRLASEGMLAASVLILGPLAWWANSSNRRSGKLLAWAGMVLLIACLLYIAVQPNPTLLRPG
jgi:serine/threonine protein kinase